MRALLDTSVLIALLDSRHVHHDMAAQWLNHNATRGWASCPLTINGCIRIMSQPAYPHPVPMQDVAQRLTEAMAESDHEFWPDDINVASTPHINWQYALRSAQLTDIYLLALAVKHEGYLLTLDRGIARLSVSGAQDKHLITLP